MQENLLKIILLLSVPCGLLVAMRASSASFRSSKNHAREFFHFVFVLTLQVSIQAASVTSSSQRHEQP